MRTSSSKQDFRSWRLATILPDYPEALRRSSFAVGRRSLQVLERQPKVLRLLDHLDHRIRLGVPLDWVPRSTLQTLHHTAHYPDVRDRAGSWLAFLQRARL